MNDDREYDPSHLTPEQRAEYDAIPDDFTIYVEEDDEPAAPRISAAAARRVIGHRMMSVTTLFSLPPVEWFVDGLVPAGPRTLLHGPGGSKKSFLVLDWVLSAATATPWLGRRVTPGRVLYIVGEGVSGTGKRVRAWLAQHPEVDPTLPDVYFMPVAINLFTLNENEAGQWSEVIQALNFKYIVIDTIHQSMSGGEENSAAEIGKVLENATKIAGAADLILVHHDPKGNGDGRIGSPRGSSALRDSVDVCLQLLPAKDNPLSSVLTPDKVRDAEPFAAQHLRFGVHGERGSIDSSLYIAGVDDGRPTVEVQEQLTRSEDQRRVLAWLKDKRRQRVTITSKTALARMVGGRYTDTARAIQELLDDGALILADGGFRPAPAPGAS